MFTRSVEQIHTTFGALHLCWILQARSKKSLIEEPLVATVRFICNQDCRVLPEPVLRVQIEHHVVHYQLIASFKSEVQKIITVVPKGKHHGVKWKQSRWW